MMFLFNWGMSYFLNKFEIISISSGVNFIFFKVTFKKPTNLYV